MLGRLLLLAFMRPFSRHNPVFIILFVLPLLLLCRMEAEEHGTITEKG